MAARTFMKPTTPTKQKMVTVELPESAYKLYRSLLDRPAINAIPNEDLPCYGMADNNIELYPYPPETQKKEGVPAGEMRFGKMEDCAAYPGVSHDYAVYIPAGLANGEPANLLVLPDMVYYLIDEYYPMHLSTMMDNLIAQGDIPKTVVLLVGVGDSGPGIPVYGANPAAGLMPDNRSVEYDNVDDRFATFLVEEVMPVALEGLSISDNPADVCILGTSSGGHAALAAAWHRNDVFGAVAGVSATLVDVRGGSVWPRAIRASAKKNLKVFLAAGECDMNTLLGDFLLGNRQVFSALQYKGYKAKLIVAKCGHTLNYLGHIIPTALRYIWGNVNVYPEHSEVYTAGE